MNNPNKPESESFDPDKTLPADLSSHQPDMDAPTVPTLPAADDQGASNSNGDSDSATVVTQLAHGEAPTVATQPAYDPDATVMADMAPSAETQVTAVDPNATVMADMAQVLRRR